MPLHARKKVLFLTNSQYGEASVILAVAQELLSRGDCDVHIASYSDLSPRIDAMKNGDFGGFPKESSSLTFHLFSGLSMHRTRIKKFGIEDIHHPPGFKGSRDMYTQLVVLTGTWTGEDWVRIFRECQAIIGATEPDIIVCGNYFVIGIDAVTDMGRKYMVLSPNTFMEITSDKKSFFGRSVKYPARGSGYPFPLRRRQIPGNVFLYADLAVKFVTSPAGKAIKKSRKENGIKGPIPYFKGYLKEVTYMLPSTPESDYPIPIPNNFVCCGPIFLPATLDTDEDLKAWLSRRKTVLLNLGSFMKVKGDHARELAKGIEILLNGNPDVQVLWKLMFEGELEDGIEKILHDHLGSERVRIVKWLNVEPSAIVTSGQVICSVHHGGANSYFEAISAGIPQIVLPAWLDTYEFAARVEYLGIGLYGSKKSKSAPKADGNELGEALLAVTSDTEASRAMKKKARDLAQVCNAYGGRSRAADKILELCDKKA